MTNAAPSGPSHDGRSTNGAGPTITLDLNGIRHRRKETQLALTALGDRYKALIDSSAIVHPQALMEQRMELASEQGSVMVGAIVSIFEMQSACFEIVLATFTKTKS